MRNINKIKYIPSILLFVLLLFPNSVFADPGTPACIPFCDCTYQLEAGTSEKELKLMLQEPKTISLSDGSNLSLELNSPKGCVGKDVTDVLEEKVDAGKLFEFECKEMVCQAGVVEPMETASKNGIAAIISKGIDYDICRYLVEGKDCAGADKEVCKKDCEITYGSNICVIINNQCKNTKEISCEQLVGGLDPTTDKQTYENRCKSAGSKCEIVGGQCKEAGAAAAAGLSPLGTVSGAMSSDAIKGYYEGYYGVPEDYKGALPPCAFSGTCRNVNDLLQLIINFGASMFVIIGSFAFAFFVYGGFTIVTSFGNAERVKKGKDIMVAAVVGMVIALSAYLLIDFMLDALKVDPDFRGIK